MSILQLLRPPPCATLKNRFLRRHLDHLPTHLHCLGEQTMQVVPDDDQDVFAELEASYVFRTGNTSPILTGLRS